MLQNAGGPLFACLRTPSRRLAHKCIIISVFPVMTLIDKFLFTEALLIKSALMVKMC